jgi:broad specificity phosphatase PhoE
MGGWMRGGFKWKFDIDIPEGESYQDVLKRVRKFLGEIKERHKDDTVLVVTHGAVKVAFMLILFNQKPETHYKEYKADNTALSFVEVTEEVHEAELINSLSHLD